MFFSTQMATQRHFHPLRAEVTKNTATSPLWYLNDTLMRRPAEGLAGITKDRCRLQVVDYTHRTKYTTKIGTKGNHHWQSSGWTYSTQPSIGLHTQRGDIPLTARAAGKMVPMALVEHARVRVNAERAARRPRRGEGGVVHGSSKRMCMEPPPHY